jgi:hypothetical protein
VRDFFRRTGLRDRFRNAQETVLTESSLAKVLSLTGFELRTVIDRFLPCTLINATQPPLILLHLYLAMPRLWRINGPQFLLVARKPVTHPASS